MEFKSLKNIETSLQADTALHAGIRLPVRRGDGLRPVEVVQLRRGAAAEDLRAGQRQEPDAGTLAGRAAEPPGGGTGARAPLPRACSSRSRPTSRLSRAISNARCCWRTRAPSTTTRTSRKRGITTG